MGQSGQGHGELLDLPLGRSQSAAAGVKVSLGSCAWMLARAGRPALLALLLGGCYVYRSVDFNLVSPGAAIRVHLSPEEIGRIERMGVAAHGRVVSGRVVQVRDDGLELALVSLAGDRTGSSLPAGAFASVWQPGIVALSRPDIIELELRELHQGKTALVLGTAVAATAGLVWYSVHVRGRPASPRQGPGNPDIATYPSLDFRSWWR